MPNDVYDMPINMITDGITMCVSQEYDKEILRVVQKIGIEIDKKGLVDALNQDRRRYSKAYKHGFNDGYETAKKELEKENEELKEAINKIKKCLSTK